MADPTLADAIAHPGVASTCRPARRGPALAERFALAWHGMRSLLSELAGRSIAWRVAATALVPVALCYAAGTAVRDATSRRHRVRRSYDRSAYLAHRYGGSQRFVNWREQRIVRTMLQRIDPPARVLDVPAGYGRFVPLLDGAAVRPLVCADVDWPRVRTLVRDAGAARAVAVVQADLQGALPFATGAFDLVCHLRYLHHAHTADEQRGALREIARVSRRWVLLSYYRRSNLHAVQRTVQSATRRNRRRGPAMLDGATFARLVAAEGGRIAADRALLPWFHAQRFVLVEMHAR